MIFTEKLKLKIKNTLLQASNLILNEGQKKARLTADVSTSDTVITVNNYVGFADNDYLLIGNWGEPTAEIVQINDASIDATITITALKFDHYVDTPITIIPFNQVEFSRATTLTGEKSVLSTKDISADRKDTFYQDATN